MANATFNSGIDYFGLETASNGALKVVSSEENRSMQSTSGANVYGDAAVVDSWGETAAPSAEYQVVAALTSATFPRLGRVVAAGDGLDRPVVLGGVSVRTQMGQPPSVSASGQMVQAGATQLRAYALPSFSLTTRHRAQDFLGFCEIKAGGEAADAASDYGLESVEAEFPVEVTIAQPKGETVAYDLHGGTATCSYAMNWYSATAPTVSLTASATALGATLSSPLAKSCPEGGYTQYSWTVSFPMVGEEGTGES